jgi:2-oxoisovalerate dehydrogenase E1 component alpha subunit
MSDFSFSSPGAPARPGEAPDFGRIRISAAGEARRPAIEASAKDMRDLGEELIRVLDDAGVARGPWRQDEEPEALRLGLRAMILTRAYDARMLVMQRQGHASFYMPCTGEEAVACAAQAALGAGCMHFPTYRQQGLLIAQNRSLVGMMCQVLSNTKDFALGRQLPVFYTDREAGFFSISGNLGTQFMQAVGWAMAAAIRNEPELAVGWIGEGATAESDFHAALVFASVYRPPAILIVVNNQWAISTNQSMAGGEQATFAARAHGYGLPSLRVDGNDYLAVKAAAGWARERASRGLGPTLIELLTYRAGPHSTSDDPSAYRSALEPREWPLGDPIARLSKHLVALGEWSEERQAQAVAEAEAEVGEAAIEARSYGTLREGARISPATMFENVYAETPPHLRRQRQESGS